MRTVQRSGRALDWTLLLVLGATWLAALAYGVHDGIRTQQAWTPMAISRGPGESHPQVAFVLRALRTDPPLQVGDRLLALDGKDLSGASTLSAHVDIARAARARGFATLSIERGDERFESRIEQSPTAYWWAFLPFSIVLFSVAALLLIRAPHWPLRRRLFLTAWIFAATYAAIATPYAGAFGAPALFGMPVLWVTGLGYALTVWVAQEITPSALPVPRWQRAIPIALLVLFWSSASLWYLPIRWEFWWALGVATLLTTTVGALGGITRAYLRSDVLERRQLRWVLLGFYVNFVGGLTPSLLSADEFYGLGRLIFAITLLGIPIGVLVSVVAYDFLDVDRLISATASYTLLGMLVLAGALAGIPRAAGWVASPLGIDPEPTRFALTLALIGLAIPVHRALWPRLDRRLFRERHQRELGFERLLDEIGGCVGLEELARLTGERLDALLEPESIVSYGREESLFTPVFVRGRTAAPAFEADSLLVRALEKRALPLAADAAALGPFDRAALETLGAAVLVPTRRGTDLAAFTCLGRKRSGDIYTREELAYLAAIANRCSEVLVKLSDEVVLREARALQHSLRRYVPGAVADALLSGRDLEPEEREVSILFVDIRGYASFAERRRAEEIFSTLNSYTEQVSRVITAKGGSVVEFNGDGMMAVFGAPQALEKKERAALEAARELIESLGGGISVGVGIATGEAYVGSIRGSDRSIWSAVGNTTNLAARLQALTRELDATIAVDATTRERAGYVCADFVRHEGSRSAGAATGATCSRCRSRERPLPSNGLVESARRRGVERRSARRRFFDHALEQLADAERA